MNKKPVHALTISVVIIVFAWLMITRADFAFGKETGKVGVGDFVMAVSYTESYDDLQYVANFANCIFTCLSDIRVIHRSTSNPLTNNPADLLVFKQLLQEGLMTNNHCGRS